MELPRTRALRPRPVWARHLRRSLLNLEYPGPPTEAEKHDAIKVLRDPDNAGVPGLWLEAHRILDESSPPIPVDALLDEEDYEILKEED